MVGGPSPQSAPPPPYEIKKDLERFKANLLYSAQKAAKGGGEGLEMGAQWGRWGRPEPPNPFCSPEPHHAGNTHNLKPRPTLSHAPLSHAPLQATLHLNPPLKQVSLSHAHFVPRPLSHAPLKTHLFKPRPSLSHAQFKPALKTSP